MRYQYDVFNRVIGQSTSLRTTTTSGTSTTPVEAAYVYNAQQRLGQITVGNIRQNATYYTNGTLAALQTGTPNTSGGIATTVKSDAYTYDGADSSLTQHTISVLGNTAYTYSYQYDSKGNITKITKVNAGSSKSINYTYDAANQLVREDNQIAGYSWAMTYDNAGNMLTRKKYSYTTGTLGSVLSTQTFTYGKDGWGDVLTKINSTTVTSDASGNLLSDGTNTYTWKNGRQLATVTRNGATWTNTYDANGMRTQRVSGSTVYAYIYDGGNLNQMTVGSNALIFTYGINGQPMSVKYNGTDYYYVTNSQGDVVGILNGSGTEVVTYTYDAWGNILSTTGTMAGTLGTHNPLRYRGYVYDQETGLYYVSSRYYDPKICRFINADAFASTGQGIIGNNMFAYCGNNPVTRVDIGGYFWDTVFDIASLVYSAIEVFNNPDDIGAWVGLVCDVVDVAIPCVGGLGEAARAVDAAVDAADTIHDVINTTDTLTDGIKYTDKVLKQMENTSDLHHSFPSVIDTFVDLNNAVDLVGGDNVTRKIIKIPGSINGIDGVFEYIIDLDGWCNHRYFRKLP